MGENYYKDTVKYVSEIERRNPSNVQSASRDMKSASALKTTFVDDASFIEEEIRDLFIRSVVFILEAKNIANKKSAMDVLREMVDFRRNEYSESASWHIHTDHLTRLKNLTTTDLQEQRIGEWKNLDSLYTDLKGAYGDKAPSKPAFSNRLSSLIDSLEKTLLDEGLPKRAVSKKARDYWLLDGNRKYLSPQAEKDITKWVESVVKIEDSIEEKISEGCMTAAMLSDKYLVSNQTVIQNIKLMRDEAVKAGKNPDDYAFKIESSRKSIWLVTPLGLTVQQNPNEKPRSLHSLLKPKLDEKEKYDKLLENGGKTLVVITDETGLKYKLLYNHVGQIINEAKAAGQNPDDYVSFFPSLARRPLVVTAKGFEGDEFVTGLNSRICTSLKTAPSQETSPHPPSAAGSSPASLAPAARRA